MIRFKGFSLVELITVVAIIGILASLTYPSFNNYTQNQELKNSAKELLSNLKLAQQYTVTEQAKYSVAINLMSGSYSLIKKGDPDQTIQSFSLDEDVYFSSANGIQDSEAVFNPTGAVDYSGEVFLTHQQSERLVKVTIKPSGYVNWEYYEEEE
ncbi:MAG: hypothetical protein COU22_00715 [Candidatus Komeilibacteria bacterium CG10_big_fil_rev_8_21_14_0_10_41_13]|uniref:General secretion pathway GspH domain-containing protein n=1 Tax=Candidatus Komeilibacteria bacterium CG10_big_fil_rev_8_21_14_0_10_41_13 TaxID=1974476 RepID=A0A2M6WD37_9BACT|nr:MAG: hypothetical protein COU22_00715 [Candidatus Komeilibacteria bacterium CG10_big_fil_rev_8_21_14_0_10_41_13]